MDKSLFTINGMRLSAFVQPNELILFKNFHASFQNQISCIVRYIYLHIMVWFWDNCPREKLSPSPNAQTNHNSNPNPNRGQFSQATSVWLPPNSKVNPALDPNPNPYEGDKGGGNFPPGNCSDTHGVSNKSFLNIALV